MFWEHFGFSFVKQMFIDFVDNFGKLLLVPPDHLLYIASYFVISRSQLCAILSSPSSYEMRTSVGNKHVPAFLTKLWKLVGDSDCDDLISWSESGNSFVIHNDVQFAKELLPMYFKHNHMASFVRQLNMYGFRKLNHIEYGGMHYTSNEIEFYHQYFIRGQESLLKMIKRKVSNSKVSDVQESKPGSMRDVALSIKDIKDHQQTTEKIVKDLKQQNEILWKQLAAVNERCVKQQRLLTQLVPLFFDMVQPSPSLPYKRKAPLMIDDGLAMKKISRLSPQYLDRQNVCSSQADAVPSSPFSISNSGPVIHDVTEMETKKPYADEISRSPEMPKEGEVFVDSPLSCKLGNSEQMADSPFAEREVMEPFNILNFSRGSVIEQDSTACEQPLTSPCIPFPVDVADVKTSGTKNFSPFNSFSTTGSPSLDGSCSPAMALSDGSCHSEYCSNDKTVPAVKAVLDSVSNQNRVLSNRLISDTCLGTKPDVAARNEEPFTMVTSAVMPSLLPTSNAQSTVAASHANCSLTDSSNVSSASLSMNNNACPSDNVSNEGKIKLGPNGSQNGAVWNALTSGNFDENGKGTGATNFSWSPNSENTSETNIDNWLGQLFRSEGIITGGCDLEMNYNI